MNQQGCGKAERQHQNQNQRWIFHAEYKSGEQIQIEEHMDQPDVGGVFAHEQEKSF